MKYQTEEMIPVRESTGKQQINLATSVYNTPLLKMPNSFEHIKDTGKFHNEESSVTLFTTLSQSLVDNLFLSSF